MSLKTAAEFITSRDNFILTTHINPDGDGLGTIIGLIGLLKSLKKNYRVILHDKFPEKMKFLEYSEEFESMPVSIPPHSFPNAIIVDSPSFKRIGDVAELLVENVEVINMDHHESNENYAHFNLVYPHLSSSAEVAVKLYKELGLKPDKAAANGLYAGICTDTGRFRFSNTTAEALSDSAWLVAAGAEPELIATKFFYETSIQTSKALAKMLGSIELHNGGTIAFAHLDFNYLFSDEVKGADTDGFANHPLSIKGVKAGCFFKENSPGVWRVNFRSQTDEINMNVIASKFNGGGHPRASGATITGSLEEIQEKILAALGVK